MSHPSIFFKPLLVLLPGLFSACSWSTVRPVPASPAQESRVVNCSASRTAPRVDRTLALAGTISAAALAAFALIEPGEEGWETGLIFLAVGVPAGVASVPFWLSSQYGYKHAARCETLLDQNDSGALRHGDGHLLAIPRRGRACGSKR